MSFCLRPIVCKKCGKPLTLFEGWTCLECDEKDKESNTMREWEQSNIEVLTSREMGEWLSRRENRLLEQIRAEIEETIESYVCDKEENTMKAQGMLNAMQMTFEIIDKHTKGE